MMAVLTVEERFWSKVNENGPVLREELGQCWVWIAGVSTVGYGRFKIDGVEYSAHRISYWLTHGELPGHGLILHRCDNKLCVRPEHLYAGTHADNIRDSIRNDHRGKLTAADRKSILEDYTPGWGLNSSLLLAEKYGVHQSTILNVVSGRCWWLADDK